MTSLLAMIAVVSISRGKPPPIFALGIGLNALIAIRDYEDYDAVLHSRIHQSVKVDLVSPISASV